MKTADLVIQPAVAPVLGQAFDDRIQHLDTALAASRLQSPQIRQRGLLERPKKEAEALLDLLFGQIAVFAAIPPRGVVLHVDDQQCRMPRIDLDLTAQRRVHTPLSRSLASASGRSRARRAAQAAWPAGSAIRSWRISISTCGRPRCSPCTGTV